MTALFSTSAKMSSFNLSLRMRGMGFPFLAALLLYQCVVENLLDAQRFIVLVPCARKSSGLTHHLYLKTGIIMHPRV